MNNVTTHQELMGCVKNLLMSDAEVLQIIQSMSKSNGIQSDNLRESILELQDALATFRPALSESIQIRWRQ